MLRRIPTGMNYIIILQLHYNSLTASSLLLCLIIMSSPSSAEEFNLIRYECNFPPLPLPSLHAGSWKRSTISRGSNFHDVPDFTPAVLPYTTASPPPPRTNSTYYSQAKPPPLTLTHLHSRPQHCRRHQTQLLCAAITQLQQCMPPTSIGHTCTPHHTPIRALHHSSLMSCLTYTTLCVYMYIVPDV